MRRELWQIPAARARGASFETVSTAYMEEAPARRSTCSTAAASSKSARQKSSGCREGDKAGPAARGHAAAPLQSRLLAEHGILDAVPSGRCRALHPARQSAGTRHSQRWILQQRRLPRGSRIGFMTLLNEDAAKSSILPGDGETRCFLQPILLRRPSWRSRCRTLVRKFGDFTAVRTRHLPCTAARSSACSGRTARARRRRSVCSRLVARADDAVLPAVGQSAARTRRGLLNGYVAQKFSLYSSLSVYENLRFFGGAYGLTGAHLFPAHRGTRRIPPERSG